MERELKSRAGELKSLIGEEGGFEQDRLIEKFVRDVNTVCLRKNLLASEVLAREIGVYPIDDDGFAVSFDPIEEGVELREAWENYGLVVAKQVITPELAVAARTRIGEIIKDLSQGRMDVYDRSTYAYMPVDPNGTPLISRGFLEIYHDDILAQIRQSVGIYLAHVIIWGRADLWTSFDRMGVKLPGHEESKALPLHVDQNPKIHPDFRTVQGVLALGDCPTERGTFVAVPGSNKYFGEYTRIAQDRGQYVQLPTDQSPITMLKEYAQPIPLRAGDLVLWDSRTVHSNTDNTSSDVRMVAYVAQGPAREGERMAVRERAEAFESGMGKDVRDAMMHASKKPRYTNLGETSRIRKQERLNLLGKLLYGQRSYRSVI